jgi:hypothetical protein
MAILVLHPCQLAGESPKEAVWATTEQRQAATRTVWLSPVSWRVADN